MSPNVIAPRESVIPESIRPLIAPILASASAYLVGWLAKKGINLTPEQANGLMITVGLVLAKLYAAIFNPNDAAAPRMMKTQPGGAYAGEAEAADDPPVDALPELQPNDPTPTPASSATQFIAGYVCKDCRGRDGAHYGWCLQSKDGTGIPPTGFFDDTQLISREYMAKVAKQMEAAAEPANVEKSTVLKPRVEATTAKASTKTTRKATKPGAPQPPTRSPEFEP